MSAGPMELALLMFLAPLLSGTMFSGLPLGMPPGAEDPAMAHVAPEECLLYVTWSGTATADLRSGNRTERLLAEPELRHFFDQFKSRLEVAIKQGAGDGKNAQQVADRLPPLLAAIATHPTAFFVGKVALGPEGLDAPIGLVVNFGDQAEQHGTSLAEILEIVARGQTQTVEAEGKRWHEIRSQPGMPPVRFGVHNGFLIVGVGENTCGQIVERLASDKIPAWLSRVRQRLPVPRFANMTYVNLDAIVASAAPLAAAQPELLPLLGAMGIGDIQEFATVSGLDETQCVSRTWLNLKREPRGLLAPLAAKPLTREDLAPIPADASLAFAARLDAKKVFDEMLGMIDRFEPGARQQTERGMEELQNETGFHLADDLLGSLGDIWCLYQSPSEGGALFTGWTAVVTARDPAKLQEVAEKIAAASRKTQALFESQGRSRRRMMLLERFEFQGESIFFMNFIGDEIPFAPAFCVAKGQLVVSLFPQGVKAYLAREAGSDSLAELPAIADQFSETASPTMLSYCDSPRVFRSIYPLVQMFGNVLCAELQREGLDINLSLLPSQGAIGRHLAPAVSTVIRGPQGIEITNRRTLPIGLESAQFSFMAMFLGISAPVRMHSAQSFDAPVAESIAEAVSPARASRRASINNLKQIALAMHNFHDTHNRFPSAAPTDKQGKPLLSWRVQILPFLDESALFNQFHHDEPWDSPHNKKLLAQMPAVYRPPGSKAAAEKTNYLTLRGSNTMFPAGNDKVSFAQITDGTSNTILAVEATDEAAVAWTKPDDLEFDEKKPLAHLVGLRAGGFLAAMGDGSVHFISEKLATEMVRRLAIRNDGAIVDMQPREFDDANARDAVEERLPRVEEEQPATPAR